MSNLSLRNLNQNNKEEKASQFLFFLSPSRLPLPCLMHIHLRYTRNTCVLPVTAVPLTSPSPNPAECRIYALQSDTNALGLRLTALFCLSGPHSPYIL